MEFSGICGIAAVCSAALLIVSRREKELSQIIAAVIYVIVLFYIFTQTAGFWSKLKDFLILSAVNLPLKNLAQAGGIALLGTVTATVCEEVGQKGTARVIETLTVMEILQAVFPLVKEICDKLFKIFGD